MSGGSFEYGHFRISGFAEELAMKIHENNTKDEYGWSNDFCKETIERLKHAHHIIEKTGELAKEIEWLYSGDTSDESFCNAYDELMDGWQI